MAYTVNWTPTEGSLGTYTIEEGIGVINISAEISGSPTATITGYTIEDNSLQPSITTSFNVLTGITELRNTNDSDLDGSLTDGTFTNGGAGYPSTYGIIQTNVGISWNLVDPLNDGTHTNGGNGYPVTSGSGSGATFNLVVSGGDPQALVLNKPGIGYSVGDVLQITENLSWGGFGGGWVRTNVDTIDVASATFDVVIDSGDADLVINNPGTSYEVDDRVYVHESLDWSDADTGRIRTDVDQVGGIRLEGDVGNPLLFDDISWTYLKFVPGDEQTFERTTETATYMYDMFAIDKEVRYEQIDCYPKINLFAFVPSSEQENTSHTITISVQTDVAGSFQEIWYPTTTQDYDKVAETIREIVGATIPSGAGPTATYPINTWPSQTWPTHI